MVTPELSQDALSACSHPSKPHIYCVGISSCRLVSLGVPELPPTGDFLGLLEKQVEVPQG